MDRVILHCDCNSFFASCETVLDPSLKNVPMAVCGDPENRHGIILAKNELAKRYDITTAETIYQAKKKCPQLVLVRPHRGLYQEFSRKCNAIYRDYTDMVEPFGIDESWLDVTHSRLLFGTGPEIADTIRRRFREELGLTCSVGVSFTKSFAKLGSDYKKPDATTVISRENFQKIVWPLPVSALLFAGKAATAELKKMMIFSIGDLAQADRDFVVRRLGKGGALLHDYANGIDDSPVETIYAEHEQKSVSTAITFRRDLVTEEDVRKGIMTVAEELSGRMRRHDLQCTTLTLTIRYPDFSSKNKQMALPRPTMLQKDLTDAALCLLRDLHVPGRPIRLLSLAGSHLVAGDCTAAQLSLFDDPARHDKLSSAEEAVANIREKYGLDAVSIGGLMNKDF